MPSYQLRIPSRTNHTHPLLPRRLRAPPSFYTRGQKHGATSSVCNSQDWGAGRSEHAYIVCIRKRARDVKIVVMLCNNSNSNEILPEDGTQMVLKIRLRDYAQLLILLLCSWSGTVTT
jgi:hypothetical protein